MEDRYWKAGQILEKIRKETEFHLQKLENYIKTLFPF